MRSTRATLTTDLREWVRAARGAAALLLLALASTSAPAAEAECLKCHEKLAAGKFVHAPLQKGCDGCHGGLDASTVPHRATVRTPKALSAPEPELCMSCHEAAGFKGLATHAPVAAGRCSVCHAAHSSDQPHLLTQPVSQQCLGCHAEVAKAPHVIVGFSAGGHPLGTEQRATPVMDPLRAGERFGCTSCHQPHKSDFTRLGRFESRSRMDICQRCHQK